MIKLAAIYNIFDGTELLYPSIVSIQDDVDVFILVYQKVSNYGEPIEDSDCMRINYIHSFLSKMQKECHLVEYIPNHNNGMWNETNKRNLGIQKAKDLKCTHFIQMDCDELYENFGSIKQDFLNSDADGSVLQMMTYFKRPSLRFENPDNYFVPFIHKLYPNTVTGSKKYPFYCDPTRRINTENVILLSGFMHHFSYIRLNIQKKLRNSSARMNIESSNLLADYMNPNLKEGYFVKDFNQKLINVPDLFKLSGLIS